MHVYSKRKGIIISIIISIVILLSLYFILNKFKEIQKKEEKFNQAENQIILSAQFNQIEEKNEEKEEIIMNQYKNNEWRIFISKINLDAPILEGTTTEILRRGVGHFKATSKWNGNVVLAAHNRGYKYNFFQEIKNLELGDIIEYNTNEGKRKYSVAWKGKIKETDFSPLENTKDNKLTLITCAQNMPEYRLCIQAIQID